MSKFPDLIKNGEVYLKAGINVMLTSWHGVGKTTEVMRLCEEAGERLAYFSCSTLDPFTDLVGVPVPRITEDGREYLKMVRPLAIQDATVIFFDELNRAEEKVRNAVLEIVLFRTINGEPLPNLKCVWAAINPPDKEYDVEPLDPALLDRFKVTIDLKPQPNVVYMSTPKSEGGAGLPRQIAQALYSWWILHDTEKRGFENYISPRKLVDIGEVYMVTHSVEHSIPSWVNAERSKLALLLKTALDDVLKPDEDDEDEEAADPHTADQSASAINAGAHSGFIYSHDWMKANAGAVSRYLRANPDELDTHTAVIAVLEPRHAPVLARDYAEIMDALKPALLEGFIEGMNNQSRIDLLKKRVEKLIASDPAKYAGALSNLKAVLKI